MNTILLLEDDPILSKEIKEYLEAKSYQCKTVYDGELFLKIIKNETFDLYLLDINVPKINGLELCKIIRQTDSTKLIMMLTAFGEIDDKVEAFNKGADDYMVKPFHLEELNVRIQALFRRKEFPQHSNHKYIIADLEIDYEHKTVFRNQQEISLTPKEFKLLSILAEAKGRVLSKNQIAAQLWDYHIETNQNTIEVYINFLRNKIDKNYTEKLIQTKVGFGYFIKQT